MRPKGSIIIPVGPAETHGPALFQFLQAHLADWEILLVSGPGDNSVPLRCPAWGRAQQMNFGAERAQAPFLWFLHCDSVIDKAALEVIHHLPAQARARTLYYCSLAFLPDGPRLTRLNQWGANWRSRFLGLPFGDQGFLLRKEDFFHSNQFSLSAPAEDLDFIRRWKRGGGQLQCLPGRIQTSARKYARQGWSATTWGHLKATFFSSRTSQVD